jgi:hypothetical protein
MLKRIQPYFDYAYWQLALWYQRGRCVYWACVVWLHGGDWPKNIWPKK